MKDEVINKSIDTNELQLTSWEKFDHYGIVFFSFLIPLMPLYFYLKDLINGDSDGLNFGMLLFIIIPSIIGLLFYRLQRNRLKFKIVETNLPKDEVIKIINQVATELKWKIYKTSDKIIEAKTYPSFFSGSWGEQITILFDNKRILVNSICDLDQRSSVVSMGRNKKNMNKLIQEIEQACH